MINRLVNQAINQFKSRFISLLSVKDRLIVCERDRERARAIERERRRVREKERQSEREIVRERGKDRKRKRSIEGGKGGRMGE